MAQLYAIKKKKKKKTRKKVIFLYQKEENAVEYHGYKAFCFDLICATQALPEKKKKFLQIFDCGLFDLSLITTMHGVSQLENKRLFHIETL